MGKNYNSDDDDILPSQEILTIKPGKSEETKNKWMWVISLIITIIIGTIIIIFLLSKKGKNKELFGIGEALYVASSSSHSVLPSA